MKAKERRPHAVLVSFAPRSLAALALLASSCGSSTFGSDDDVGSNDPSTVRALNNEARVDLPGRVSVFLRVETGNGDPAADLTGADFNIYENGVLVSQSESFQQIRPQPQVFRSYLHLILDRSNSVQSVGAQDVEAAALEFIDVVTAQESNYVKISWFDGSPGLHPIAGHDIGFSNNASALRAAIGALNDEPPFSTSTNLYGAVLGGLEDLDEIEGEAEMQGVENRALTLVTFTDGTHQAGGALSAEDVADEIAAGSSLGTEFGAFTIGVGQEIDPSVLSLLGPSGSVAASEFGLLTEAFVDVGDQVRRLANSFYFLSYCSPKTGGINELTISVREEPSASNDVQLTFDASFFGAGCAFLDVRNHPELGSGLTEVHVTDAVETPNGVVLVGWRSAGCAVPGCHVPATAFAARLAMSPASAAPNEVEDGFLDNTFGDSGVALLEGIGVATSGATSVAYDPSTSALIVGGFVQSSTQAEPTQAALWTVAQNGSSVTRTNLANPANEAQAAMDVVRLGNGSLLVGGYRGESSRSSVLWKLLPSLSADTSFGVDGVVREPEIPAFGHEGISDLVVGGMNRVYATERFADRARVLAFDRTSGLLVPSFGSNGVVELRSDFGGASVGSRAGGAALDGQGRIVIAGTLTGPLVPGGVTSQPALWRLLDTGAADSTFVGSESSPTFGTGVVTLRQGSTNDPDRDFGRPTTLEAIALGPDGTILATGERMNGAGDTDMVVFAHGSNGVLESDFNFVGFIIDDGASADDSFERGTVIEVLSSGAIWTLGTSTPPAPAGTPGGGPGPVTIPTVWVDRDPARAFQPLGM